MLFCLPLDLESVLAVSDFSDLLVIVPVVVVSQETSAQHSQYLASIAWVSLLRPEREGGWLVMVNHIILDMFRESIVSLSQECCFTPLYMCGWLHKFNEVLCSLMILLHAKSLKFGFCFADGIVGPEIGLQLLNEESEIGEPCRFGSFQKCGFETV